MSSFSWAVGLVFALGLPACGSDESPPSGTFEPPAFGEWIKYEPDGAVCSDGSPYAFYVEFSETSENVIVFFMGGGGCWDYDSCVSGGARGAVNRDGLPDDYANVHANVAGNDVPVGSVYPLMNRDPAVSPMADWNKVFVPYCTGDVYAGSTDNVYEDPDGIEAPAMVHHQGHANVVEMTEMLNAMFTTVPKLFVSGCSAGGTGAIVNYYFIRTGIEGVERGYLLDDSGPIFPSREPDSRSTLLHEQVRDVWRASTLIGKTPEPELLDRDFGALSRVLANEFPEDRLATTMFRLDYSFSLYSYERFWTREDPERVGPVVPYTLTTGLGLDENVALDRAAVHQLWWDDIALLRTQYDAVDNLAYYLPFYRTTNDSHCVTVPGFEDIPLPEALDLFQNDFASLAWLGSEIEEMNLRDFVEELLDDQAPLRSYFEEAGEGPFVSCAPSSFDADQCEAAVNSVP